MLDLQFVVPVLLMLGVLGMVAWLHARRRAEFVTGFAGDSELRCEAKGSFGELRIHTRHSEPPAMAVPASTGGKHKVHFWRIQIPGVVFAGGSGLAVSREGMLGRMREQLGFPDLHTGDAAFDANFTVRSNRSDAARAALAEPSRRQAIESFFAAGKVRSCRLEPGGRLEVEILRRGLDRDSCREAIRRTQKLARGLVG